MILSELLNTEKKKKKCLTNGTLGSKKESALEESLPRKTGGLGFRCLPVRKKNGIDV